MKTKQYDYAVIGAGLAGCVFAYEASRMGKNVIVIEKRNHIGGNCYIERQGKINVHKYGAHIFKTNDKELFDYVNSFVELNNFINTPIAKYKKEVYNLPFNMNTFCQLFGVTSPEQVRDAINETRVVNENPKNLEEHCLNVVGRVVYEKLIKGYTEKQWGRRCTELPVDVMRRIPIRYTFNNNYYNEQYQGCGDYTKMFIKMLKDCDLMLDVDYVECKQWVDDLADKVLYTGSLDELFGYCFGELEYRGLKFVTEEMNTDNYQGVAVVNHTDVNVPYTRTIEHKHFMNDVSDKTIVTAEYPIKWTRGLERYYPINDEVNNARHKQYKELAEQNGLLLCGRLAEYRYYDMQDTIRSALSLVNKELAG